MKRFCLKALIMIIGVLLVSPAFAGVPRTINYQGYLTDAAGNPVGASAPVSVSMTFGIYNVSSGGTALWTETQGSVTVSKGIFKAILGSVTPVNLSFEAQYYLGVKVGADTEMTPRQALSSAPSALNADTLDGTHAVDLQNRISGTCAAGSSIRTVNADGTVVCETVSESDPQVGTITTNYVPKWDGSALVTGAIFDNGNVGIGTTAPGSRLHIAGGGWDLTNSEGDFKIGTDTIRLKIGIATSGGGAGDARIRSHGGTGRIMLGSGTNDVLTITGTNVGIGTLTPNEQLEITGNLRLPETTATTGIIRSGADTLIHTYGAANFFAGIHAGNLTMTGDYNAGSGRFVLGSNTTGYKNTGSGAYALSYNNTGNNNTADGYQALPYNTTGSNNTASGSTALYSNTTGGYNTADGYQALAHNTTGSNNTAIGYNADVAYDYLTNATAIGNGATADASNHVRIGNYSVTQIGGQVAWSNLSDMRGKEDIRDIGYGLEFIRSLRPVEFRLKNGNDRLDFGFIAQDIETLLGTEYNILGIGSDAERRLSLRYTDFIAPMVKAIQEQQKQIESQQAQIDELKKIVEELRAKL